jgi:hypothetical protein
MANYETLKAAIQHVIKTNDNNEITGALLQQSLLAIINSLGIGYQFIGIATCVNFTETSSSNKSKLDDYLRRVPNATVMHCTYKGFGLALSTR